MPDMQHARTLPGAVEWRGKLIVAGGYLFRCARVVSFVEAYNPLTGEWEEMAPLNYVRGAPVLVVCDGYLLCFGGYDEYEKGIVSAEQYSPTHGRLWMRLGSYVTVMQLWLLCHINLSLNTK